MAIDIEGLDELNSQLERIAQESPQAVEAGAFAGGLLVQGEAQRRTPVEYGNLQGSAYTNRISGGAEVGFSADYALFVHENMEQKLLGEERPSGLGTYWNPGGPKYLERAVNENIENLNRIILGYVKKALGQ